MNDSDLIYYQIIFTLDSTIQFIQHHVIFPFTSLMEEDGPASTNLTTASGCPVDNDLASMTSGTEMPYTLIQDQNLIEKLAHFNRERIPERPVHAKGAGAFGYFQCTKNMSRFTSADFLSAAGKKTNVFIRFSTVSGERGSADALRDLRGFAVRFYTNQGNYDVVGNNSPIFFIRDAVKFPDFAHSQKRNPQTNLPDPNIFWDFLSLTPESIHQTTMLFSDRGTPKSYRMMDGFGVNTYMWYNKEKEYVWVKYHFRTLLGNQTLTNDEAEELCGKCADSHTKDLFNAIKEGDFPQWKVYVQIMTQKQALQYQFDPFDPTKVWYKADFPLQEIGIITLNKNPENYYNDVELAAFAPSHFVPGVGPSPDKLLQGRLFAYPDSHNWRLGSNNQQIPVNRSKASVNTNQKDGNMTINGNGGYQPNYWPNSFGTTQPDERFTPPEDEINAVIMKHVQPLQDIDFIQPRCLYKKVMRDVDRDHLISNIVGHLKMAKQNLQYRQTALFFKCDPEYGTRVAEGLGIDVSRVRNLAAMSQEKRVAAT
ncbi:Catalase [Tritrichomonas foetus]|uniref:Catalase n=1 Tax=Tritrichomonas foetus TaxID=1144522 RepID=A0A1J4KZX7_9EUKA|nr:Catalase [Tritrichomonas foetus]|eukprot:OHT15254.1 Catalase [Tritrichomonas foetus]